MVVHKPEVAECQQGAQLGTEAAAVEDIALVDSGPVGTVGPCQPL